MDTNETCVSYFARVYGIDFTETEGGMKKLDHFDMRVLNGSPLLLPADSLPGRN